VNRRIPVSLALALVAAFAITACGGGSNDEGKITEVIEQVATTSKAANCTEVETLRFKEQNSKQKGKAATKSCEKEAEADQGVAEGAAVSNVSVNGEKATAEVEFEGGSLASQTIEVALVKEGGDWKVDQIEGFAQYNGKALGTAFQKQFEESPEGLSTKQVECIAEEIAGLSKAEAETVVFGPSANPIIELAKGCA
jgi:hypothetical protein